MSSLAGSGRKGLLSFSREHLRRSGSRGENLTAGRGVFCLRPDPSTNFTILHIIIMYHVRETVGPALTLAFSLSSTLRIRTINKTRTCVAFSHSFFHFLPISFYRANGMVIICNHRRALLSTKLYF